MSGTINLPHTCLNVAQQLQEKFGYRTINTGSATNQSWCKKCRS